MLAVGETYNQRVYCGQSTGPVPTSIEWYNPQGQLVSRNNREEVNQVAGTAGGRVAVLTFRSYQQSQGGEYECRVTGLGNNTERLPVCIGKCYTVKSATSDNGVFLVPSMHHLYCVHHTN